MSRTFWKSVNHSFQIITHVIRGFCHTLQVNFDILKKGYPLVGVKKLVKVVVLSLMASY